MQYPTNVTDGATLWTDFVNIFGTYKRGTADVNSYPLDKMAAILAGDVSKRIFLNENGGIPMQISLKFVPRSSIDHKPALVQVMTWHRTGDKPSSEPMMTQFTIAYMQH